VLETDNQNKRHAVRNKAVGYSTIAQRTNFYYRFFTDLVDMGYRLTDVRGLKRKHIIAWAQNLEAKDRSSSTLQKYVSMIKTFTKFIGKPDLIGDPRDLLIDPANFERQYVSNVDKSDEGKAISWTTLSQLVAQHDTRLAAQYAMMKPFGLRFEEASKIKPFIADRGDTLHVVEGTKGGRPRDLPIDTPEKRQVLDYLKTLAVSPNGSTIPKHLRYSQWQQRAYYINRKVGFTKSLAGYTPHGLRHGFANNRYQVLTGTESPVRGGQRQSNDLATEHQARLQLSRELGHSREQITAAYIGSKHNANDSGDDDVP
jgi:integrase